MKRKILPVFKKGYLIRHFGFRNCPSVMFAQPVKITGTVKDASNVPLIGVTVVEKGTTNGDYDRCGWPVYAYCTRQAHSAGFHDRF